MNINSKDIYIVARKRGFWDFNNSQKIFKRVLLLPSRNFIILQIIYTVLSFLGVLIYQPKVLFLATSTKLPHIYAKLRQLGLFKDLKIITDAQYINESVVKHMDKIIIYSPNEHSDWQKKYNNKFIFIHYPSKTELVNLNIEKKDYILCGGNHLRDFTSIIKAARELSYNFILVTRTEVEQDLPDNVKLMPQMSLKDYLQLMASAYLVMVPLQASHLPHGHCDISCALSLGKPVISTKQATVDEYIDEGNNGFLVEPGNIEEYKKTITRLYDDQELYQRVSNFSRDNAIKFKYQAYADKIIALSNKIII